ncbi:MAG TPA: exo-alpha-sialidase [Rhodocyclaceae bacterium]|nr:exo-alpha-sialidase [Rhodocyclaceae bacterium]
MITLARLPLLLFGAWWRALPPPATAFVVPAPSASTLPTQFADTPLSEAGTPAYGPSLARLSAGGIAAAWLQASPDRPLQTTVRLAFWNGHQWSPPRIIVDRRLLAMGGKSQVQTMGPPRLFEQDGRLHLWLSGQSAWGSSRLYHLASDDRGENWSPPELLPTSPLFNLGSRDPMPPLALADGGVGLPTSHALFSRHGEWLRFDAHGQLIDKARMSHGASAQAPQPVALDGQGAVALLRDADDNKTLHTVSTRDGGARWQAVENTAPPASTASLALLRLASGSLLLAAHAADGVSLWVSADDGRQWRRTRSLNVSAPAELALAQGSDGQIHLVAGTPAQGLRHLRFSEAWLQEPQR